MTKRSLVRRAAEQYSVHAAAVSRIGIASIIGIAVTFIFQIVAARFLGVAEFGILSAFFAIVSIAAFGSGALQNAVAVRTARVAGPRTGIRGPGGFTVEALVLGGGGAIGVALAAPWIAAALETEIWVPVLAAFSILLSFLSARAIGGIQGAGRSEAAVWWSTVSLVLRLAIVVVAMLAGWGLGGALIAVVAGSLVATVGAYLHVRSIGATGHHRPFQAEGLVVIGVTLCFAWVTNIDVVLVRAQVDPTLAGLYGAAAVLIKAGFLVPTTLSIYLLPRFVKRAEDAGMTRAGVNVTLAITAASGLLVLLIAVIAGPLLIALVYGPSFSVEPWLVTGLAAAYLPWFVAQGLLIRMTALASRPALIVCAVLAVGVTVASGLVLPAIPVMLGVIGGGGVAAVAAFLTIDARAARLDRGRVGSTPEDR